MGTGSASGTAAWASRFGRWTRWLETAVLAGLLAVLLSLGVAQIVLRNVFDGSLLWADPVVRAAVLWLGLAGAVTAAREGRHIRIDLLQRWLAGWPLGVVEALANGAAAVVCAIVAWHGGRMVLGELAYASPGGVPGELFPAWALQLIIPVAFGLMAVLHAGYAFTARTAGRSGASPSAPTDTP